MEIPTPPTDSLYKFQAIGGIIIVLGSIYFGWRLVHDFKEQVEKAMTATMASEAEMDTLVRARKKLDVHISTVDQLLKTAQDAKLPNKAIIDALGSETQALVHDRDALDAAAATFRGHFAAVRGESEAVRNSVTETRWFLWSLLGFVCTGLIQFFQGIKRWYHRVQRPQDELLTIQLEEARLALFKKRAESTTPPHPDDK